MSPSPILETRDLSRHFGGLKAVEDVTLQITAGHFHSIIGPNGAGKTTLFNLLSGVLPPTRGQVLLRGQEITTLPVHRRAHLGIGRSYQVTNIFPALSVLENVRIAAQALGGDNFKLFANTARFRHYQERAWQALAETGLSNVATMPALTLAHGDKRRLELAILLAQEPAILLLDEPTAGLAGELAPAFMELVARLCRQGQRTVVLVEHNMDVVMTLSDRISVMHQGQLLAEGTPVDIAANPVVQQAYLGELYEDVLAKL